MPTYAVRSVLVRQVPTNYRYGSFAQFISFTFYPAMSASGPARDREKQEVDPCRQLGNNFFFIIYSQKVQIKYIADTRPQESNQEKHMVIWLQVVTATWLRYQSMLIASYIVGKCNSELTLSLTAHLMLLISLQSYKLAPP